MKYLLLLALSGCASQVPLLQAKFVDTDGIPEEGTAHVCIAQKRAPMDCLTLEAFMGLMMKARRDKEEKTPTSDL